MVSKRENPSFGALILRASALAALVAVAAPGMAAAQDDSDGGVKWTLGAGVGGAPDYEGSDDYEVVPIPLLRAAWGRGYNVSISGSTLRALQIRGNAVPNDLISGGRIEAGPLANFRMERDDVDNDRVDDLEDVDPAFEMGAFVGYVHEFQGAKGPTLGANFQFAADVTDEHDGWLLQPGIDFVYPLGDFRFTSRTFSTFATSGYMETYFGIDSDDARRSGLDEFDADAGFKDWGLSLGVNYAITQSWNVGLLGSYTLLLDDAKDSPVTDDEGSEHQLFGGILVSSTF